MVKIRVNLAFHRYGGGGDCFHRGRKVEVLGRLSSQEIGDGAEEREDFSRLIDAVKDEAAAVSEEPQ